MNRQLNVIVILLVLASILAGCGIDLSSSAEPDISQDTSSVDASSDDASSDDSSANQFAAVEEPTVEPVQEATTNAHPAERLIATFSEASQTNGEVVVLYGQVLDVNANPLPNLAVEIRQTDASGVYDHPQDPGTGGRDTTFQFYGTTMTDADGWYAFRTVMPGHYEPRPRHIHFKVKQDEVTQGSGELLTSQFYFSDDIAQVQSEGMFQAVGDSGDLLLLQLVQGEGQLLANGQIVVDTGVGSGSLPLTPSQAEGPYYPVVDLTAADNDLVRLP